MTPGATRRAGPADADALAGLDAASFDAPWDASSIGTLLAGELTIGWRRDAGSELVAAALVRCVAGEAELLRLAVHPAHRRHGHGRALLATILEELGPGLPHGLHLEVRASNAAARSLYHSLGFALIGTRPAYYVAPVEGAVLMRWNPATRPSDATLHHL